MSEVELVLRRASRMCFVDTTMGVVVWGGHFPLVSGFDVSCA